MGALEYVRDYFLTAILVAAIVIPATWGVSYKLFVEPRDYKIKELESKIIELQREKERIAGPLRKELPIKLWLGIGSSDSIIDGQILFTLKSLTSDKAYLEIKIPDKPYIREYIMPGERIEFDYLGNKYYLSILEMSKDTDSMLRAGVNIQISKKQIGR